MPDQQAIDPRNGDVIATYPGTTEDALSNALTLAHEAQSAWAKQSMSARSEALRALGQVLRERKAELAELMTREMGKPISAAQGEVEKCAWVCDYYAEEGPGFLSDRAIETDASESFVAFAPLGLVLAVMPWNFPLWQFFRCAAPALMAGDGLILKHASNVPGSALAIERSCQQVPALANLVKTVLIDGKRASALIAHPLIAAVTLTGSTAAGEQVAKQAGSQLKKCVMELGGSDAYVILADADLDLAVDVCVKARMINNGQSCIAAKRFIVVDPLYEAFSARMTERMEAIAMADPFDPETTLGPMARKDLRDDLHEQVRRSVESGARLRVGGRVPDGAGAFYPATVLADVTPGMAAFDEELFGPVAAITRARDEREALRLANQSPFGLGGAVFSSDVGRARELARDHLEVGCAFVNDQVRSDPRLPFGGIKRSGFGRELGSFGILEFVNIKTVYVA